MRMPRSAGPAGEAGRASSSARSRAVPELLQFTGGGAVSPRRFGVAVAPDSHCRGVRARPRGCLGLGRNSGRVGRGWAGRRSCRARTPPVCRGWHGQAAVLRGRCGVRVACWRSSGAAGGGSSAWVGRSARTGRTRRGPGRGSRARPGQRSNGVCPRGTASTSAPASTRTSTAVASPNSSPSSWTGCGSDAASSSPGPFA